MSCENHLKTVFGESDMRKVAEVIADLHYETLHKLFEELQMKLTKDGIKDRMAGRLSLANYLFNAADCIDSACINIKEAWNISKKFMS